MEKLYLVKLGNMYVTSASLTSIKLDETVERAIQKEELRKEAKKYDNCE